MSSGLYIVYVLYRLAEQYLIDVANVSAGPTLDIHYPIQLDGSVASNKLYEYLHNIHWMML